MSAPAPTSEPAPEGPTFEDALAQIEEIIEGLERGGPSLTEALGQYEDGVKLLRRCYLLLERAERSVALLTDVDDQGEALTAPFDASATLGQSATTAPRDEPGRAARPARPRRATRRPSHDGDASDDAPAPF